MSGGNTTDPPLPDVEFRPGGRLPPPLPRSNFNNKSFTLHSQSSERLVLVRDPPRERLARAKSSAEPEETLLARVEGKQYPYRHSTTTTTTTRSSNPSIPFPSPSAGSPTIEEEFYADLYQYYYDVTTPTSNERPLASSGRVKPKSKSVSSIKFNATSKKGKNEKDRARDIERDDGSDTERDERRDSGLVMAKKRGSLQAIFVPSFLQTSVPSDITASPPSSPTSTTASKVVQRLRALSAVPQPSTSSPHTTFSDIAPSEVLVPENGNIPPPLLHQRKRSTTFSIMTSFNSNSNFATSSIPSPTTPTAPGHSTILSPRNSPPPAFLQDDDPFANLTSAPSESMVIRSHHTPLLDASSSAQPPLPPMVHPIPRSPLNETVPLLLPSVGSVVLGASSGGGLIGAIPSPASIPAPMTLMLPSRLSNAVLSNKNAPIAPSLSSVSTSTPQKIKPKSAPSSPPASASASVSFFSGPHPLLNTHSHPYLQPPSSPRLLPARPQPRPAHQRPAFSSRPSLPSLNTLARMNIVLTKKVRKGRVGAGLPFEPWDLPSDDESLPTPPPPLSASASSPNSARLISSHNGPANSNGIMNAEPNATPNLNVNVNVNANHDSAHPTSSSTVTSIPSPMSASASIPSSPIPIPLSSTSSSTSLAPGSYLDFDSDSGSSSNSTTPTSSLVSTTSHTRSRPPSPSPVHIHTNMAKPQPLLPSQILALGSVAADVEMVIPVGNGISDGPNSMWSKSETVSRSSSQHAQPLSATSPSMVESNRTQETSGSSAPLLPVIVPAGPLLIQTSVNGQADFLSDSQALSPSIDANSHDDAGEEQARYKEDEERDEYFSALLDRYQVPSRAGSDDGHLVEQKVVEVEVGAGTAEPPIQEELVAVLEESHWNKEKGVGVEDARPPPESTAADSVQETTETEETREESASTSEHLPIHGPGSGSGDVNVDVEGGTSPDLTRSDSLFSSPPSSASLSRSFSMTSDSSIGSAESGSGVGHTGRRTEDMWLYRRFGNPSQSLSSLELDIDGGRDDESQGGFFETGVDVTSISRERAGTRSSSDDGDALQLSTPGDYEHGFFPDSHAGTFARFYQSGYSTLFSPPAPYKEDGPSFLPETDHLNLSSPSSSFDDLGGEREAGMWGKPFGEEGMDMTTSGGLAAELNRRSESGLGIDKVLIAAEECQQDEVEKEKESLANTTSIAPVRTTSTITREADRLSHPSSDHSQPVPSSLSSPPVDQELSPLHSESETQAIDSPGALIDDEMVTRHRMGPSNDSQLRPRTTPINPRTSSSAAEPMDSNSYQRHGSSNSQQYRARGSHEQTTNYNTSGSTSISAAFKESRRGERKRNSDDEEEERRRRRAIERMRWDDGVTKFPGSTSSSEEDDYGEASKSASKSRLTPWKTTAGSRSPPSTDSFMTASSRSPSLKRMDFPSSSKHSSQYVTEDEREEDDEEDDDDDVPLAQRIPGALTAQKTMRRKFREEREQRKREKAEQMQHADAERRARQETLRPAGAGVVLQDSVGVVPSSSSQDAAMFAASALHGQRRQRTLTLPGKSPDSPPSAFNPHDLARKLQNVQMAEVSSLAYQQQYQHPQQYQDPQAALSPTHARAKSLSRTSAEHQQSRSPSHTVAPPLPPLTTVRSRSIKDASPSYQIPPGPSPISSPPGHGPPTGTLRPMRSFHRPSERRPIGMEEPLPALPTPPTDIDHRLERSSTSASRNPHHRSPSQSRTSSDRPERIMEPVPPLPAPFKVLQGNDESKKLVKPNPGPESRTPSTRFSGDADRSPRLGIAQQPMPGLINVNKVVISQQRVFVGNLQQFHMVEIGPSTTAGDVVSMMEAEGALKGWAGIGGWMVFEIAQDFGMERPVRSYELLADVQASWLKDKSVNFFVLKLTPLAAPLSRNAIPASSPTHSGYIEWEAKRGKWSKRWLQLREHNLYLSKRDNGKDEVLICSLSNFDVYQITRNHRAPKPFAFAIKSTDNLSFFENTADYMHTFSCNEKDGKIWMEKILVARSYVLHQERHILFKPAGNNASAAVSRSGTKKYAPVRPNHQPLVALPPNGVFEPGSLLGKHI